ncbi:MAG: hypothetical protein JWR53_2026 [Glaciihabitans sp.]|nr:hypothetical protein [Glaciihabitans sp.]
MSAWGVVGSISVGIAAVLTLAGCASGPATSSAPDPRLRGQWELTSASDATGTLDLSPTFVTFTIGDADHTAVHTPCDDIPASVRGTAGAVYVSMRYVVPAECGQAAQTVVDRRILRALDRVDRAKVDAGTLTLSAEKVTLGFERHIANPLDFIVGKQWRLVSLGSMITGRALDVKLGTARLQFTSSVEYLVQTDCAYTHATLSHRGTTLTRRTGNSLFSRCSAAARTFDAALTRVLLQGTFQLSLRRNDESVRGNDQLFVQSIDQRSHSAPSSSVDWPPNEMVAGFVLVSGGTR